MSDTPQIPPNVPGLLAQLKAKLHDHDQASRRHNYHTPANGELAASMAKAWKANDHKTFTIDCSSFGIATSSMRLKFIHGLNWLADNTSGPDQEYWNHIRGRIKFKMDGAKLTVMLRQDIANVIQFVRAADTTTLQASLERWVYSDPRVGSRWPDGGQMELTNEAVAYFTKRMLELEAQNFVGIVTAEELQFIKVAPGTIT
jgi:hypothetical protein